MWSTASEPGLRMRRNNWRKHPSKQNKTKQKLKQITKQRKQRYVKTYCDKNLHIMHSCAFDSYLVVPKKPEFFQNWIWIKISTTSKTFTHTGFYPCFPLFLLFVFNRFHFYIYIKLYFVPVVWFWTDPALVSTVKFVFYLPDNESRRRSCVTQSSSHFHVTNKERKKSSAKCVFTTVVSLVATSIMNHSISFNRDTFDRPGHTTWPIFFFPQVAFIEFSALKVRSHLVSLL